MVCDAGFRVVATPSSDSERLAVLGRDASGVHADAVKSIFTVGAALLCRGVSAVCADAAEVLAQGSKSCRHVAAFM